MNRYGAGLSTDPHARRRGRCGGAGAAAALDGADADLAWVFASPDHGDAAADSPPRCSMQSATCRCVGAVAADGVIGTAREIEQGPAVSVWLASLDDAEVAPFALRAVGTEDGRGDRRLAGGRAARRRRGLPAARRPLHLPDRPAPAAASPTRRPRSPWRAGWPAAARPGAARLLLGREVHDARAPSAPSSPRRRCGSRSRRAAGPIGPELVVTDADGNAILGARRPRRPMERLRELVAGPGRGRARAGRPGPAGRPGDRREPARSTASATSWCA